MSEAVHSARLQNHGWNSLIVAVACLSLLALAALSALMIGLGRTQPIHTALEGFGEACAGQTRPCWNGIVPGATVIDDMRRNMAYAGGGVTLFDTLTEEYTIYFTPPEPSPICIALFQLRQNIIARVQLQICPDADLRIGDLTAALGLPEALMLIPPQNLVYAQATVTSADWRSPFSTDSHVSFINLRQPGRRRQPLYAWYGFTQPWRYCQLEPDYPLCR